MKKLVKSIALVVIAAIAGYNVYQMSEINALNNDLSLKNIENVAQADEAPSEYLNSYGVPIGGWNTNWAFYKVSTQCTISILISWLGGSQTNTRDLYHCGYGSGNCIRNQTCWDTQYFGPDGWYY